MSDHPNAPDAPQPPLHTQDRPHDPMASHPHQPTPHAATPHDPRAAARQSYSGQRLTDTEFEDAYAISGIIERDIRKSGSFYEARENYAFAFAKGKKISPDQAMDVLGDIFKARFGHSMNQTREAILKRDTSTRPDQADAYAQQVGDLIRQGDTMPFYKAYDKAAQNMAHAHDISQNRAKDLMQETYAATHGKTLYEAGKELEEQYHAPVAEAQKARKTLQKSQAKIAQNQGAKPTYNRTP